MIVQSFDGAILRQCWREMACLCGFSEKREKEQDSRLYQIESLSLVAGVHDNRISMRFFSPQV